MKNKTQNVHTISANIVKIMNCNINQDTECYKQEAELVKAHLIDNGLGLIHYLKGFDEGLERLIIEDVNDQKDFAIACTDAVELLLYHVANYQQDTEDYEGLCFEDLYPQ
jgi:hypothetical protein